MLLGTDLDVVCLVPTVWNTRIIFIPKWAYPFKKFHNIELIKAQTLITVKKICSLRFEINRTLIAIICYAIFQIGFNDHCETVRVLL